MCVKWTISRPTLKSSPESSMFEPRQLGKTERSEETGEGEDGGGKSRKIEPGACETLWIISRFRVREQANFIFLAVRASEKLHRRCQPVYPSLARSLARGRGNDGDEFTRKRSISPTHAKINNVTYTIKVDHSRPGRRRLKCQKMSAHRNYYHIRIRFGRLQFLMKLTVTNGSKWIFESKNGVNGVIFSIWISVTNKELLSVSLSPSFFLSVMPT